MAICKSHYDIKVIDTKIMNLLSVKQFFIFSIILFVLSLWTFLSNRSRMARVDKPPIAIVGKKLGSGEAVKIHSRVYENQYLDSMRHKVGYLDLRSNKYKHLLFINNNLKLSQIPDSTALVFDKMQLFINGAKVEFATNLKLK